jgi:hypothetical protein
MQKLSILFISLYFILPAFSQNAKITWGNEFKLSNSSSDLSVIYSDNSGVYLQEDHMVVKSYFVVGASTRESATLVKLDKNLNEQYRNDFNKELKGKEFEQFFVLGGKFFIVASDYSKKDKTLDLFITEVDKNTGNQSGDWQQIASWQKEEKSDRVKFKLSYNSDSTQMLLISSVEGSEKNSYEIQAFDKTIKQAGALVTISNEFDPKTFQLEDLLYTANKKIIVVGRIYEYEDGKKQKSKYLDFSKYNVRIYDSKGVLQKDINTDINAKWLVSTKVVQEQDKDLILAAFYSNEKKGKEINGLLTERIDPNTGNVITTSQKEINTSLITTPEEDNGAGDKDEDKEEKKERENMLKIKDENEGFSKYMRFCNIFYTADKGFVILAEKYHHYSYTTTSYGMNGQMGSSTTTEVYECGDLMMCKIDGTGNINWIEILPKLQRESIDGGYSYGGDYGFSVGSYFFDLADRPYYAGVGALQNNNTLNLFFNDNPKNADVLQLGQNVKSENSFRKSTCFSVSLDVNSGKYTRSIAFSNDDIPTAMPRLGSVIGDDMYLIGKSIRGLGKTKIAVAKVSVTN